jgi:hypothetical protein
VPRSRPFQAKMTAPPVIASSDHDAIDKAAGANIARTTRLRTIIAIDGSKTSATMVASASDSPPGTVRASSAAVAVLFTSPARMAVYYKPRLLKIRNMR